MTGCQYPEHWPTTTQMFLIENQRGGSSCRTCRRKTQNVCCRKSELPRMMRAESSHLSHYIQAWDRGMASKEITLLHKLCPPCFLGGFRRSSQGSTEPQHRWQPTKSRVGMPTSCHPWQDMICLTSSLQWKTCRTKHPLSVGSTSDTSHRLVFLSAGLYRQKRVAAAPFLCEWKRPEGAEFIEHYRTILIEPGGGI